MRAIHRSKRLLLPGKFKGSSGSSREMSPRSVTRQQTMLIFTPEGQKGEVVLFLSGVNQGVKSDQGVKSGVE
jgi:hypothetical protein